MIKKLLLGCVLFMSLSALVAACAPTSSVTRLPNDQYHIDVQDAIPPNRSGMTKAFNEAAAKYCPNFKIVTQQYVPNPSGTDHMIGTIECK